MATPETIPCVVHEDADLVLVHKPPGWNTHAPGPYAGEGIYDWLRHREPRWADLAIVHRLDKDTSGLLVFARSVAANRSLTQQFAAREVRKRYLLITDRAVPVPCVKATSYLVREGEVYRSRARGDAGTYAETSFRRLEAQDGRTVVEATPATGRTHQIRVHAADLGFPILGDRLYGGSPAHRLHLHAAALSFLHPADGRTVAFEAPVDWAVTPAEGLRRSCIDPGETDAHRLIHGASDGWPGWQVDRLGRYLLSQSEGPLTPAQEAALGPLASAWNVEGIYHRLRDRHVRGTAPEQAAPRLVQGRPAPAACVVRENGLQFALRFSEGYSVGLFLDQRDNRRRLLCGHVAAGFPLVSGAAGAGAVLNLFAYTCAFSVCAAAAGARVTSVDLSRKYLEWGRENFALNGIDPEAHDFIYGDVFDWLRRFEKKGRGFDVVLVDPPTFSTSKAGGCFRAEADWPRLARAALRVLNPGGVLFASTNAARLAPEQFVGAITAAVRETGREVRATHYDPQPPDFPISRAEPAHLKTVWLRTA